MDKPQPAAKVLLYYRKWIATLPIHGREDEIAELVDEAVALGVADPKVHRVEVLRIGRDY